MHDIKIFPLEERYINNAKTGEVIVDLKSGHLTVKSGDNNFVSKTRDTEARLDGLLKLKDQLFREYMLTSGELEDIILKLQFNKDSYSNIRAKLMEVSSKLLFISQTCETLMGQFTKRYEAYNKYLYIDLEVFKIAIKENTKKIIAITCIIDEMEELESHIHELKTSNTTHLDAIRKLI